MNALRKKRSDGTGKAWSIFSRGVILKVFTRRAAGAALQVSWLPVASYAFSIDWVGLPQAPFFTVVAFFLGSALTLICLTFLELKGSGRAAALLHRPLGPWIGCLAGAPGLLALLMPQTTTIHLALSIAIFDVGVGFALGLPLVAEALIACTRNQVAAASCCTVIVFSLGFFAASLMSTPLCAGVALLLDAGSATLLQGTLPKTCEPQTIPGAKLSNLYQDRRRRLMTSLWVSLCSLGVISSLMTGFFAAGVPTPVTVPFPHFSWIGAATFATLLGAGWLHRREFDFPLSFSLLTLVALLAFFPFNPGSPFNQHLALIFGMAWALCLFGMLFPLLWTMRSPVRTSQMMLSILGCCALFTGLLLGAVLFGIFWELFWKSGWLGTSFQRTLFVTTCGSLSIAVAYLCTNILVNKQQIRLVNLLAKGTFEMTLPASENAGTKKNDGASPAAESTPSLIERCRLITLERKLTPREFDVLVLLAQGNGLNKIQEDLFISQGTAITHRRNIYRKLDVHSRQELVTYVAEFTPTTDPS